MRLLAVRHAIAEDISSTGQDKDRPLSQTGREKFKKICSQLSHLNLKFDLLLDSPLLRSQQTADIFCDHFSVYKREASSNLRPLAVPADLLSEIKDYNMDSIAIVGHQPFLSKFISYCASGREEDFIQMKRGGLAFLDFPLSVQAGSAALKALIAPKYILQGA